MRVLMGDCMDVMRGLDEGSVDMVLCDLPYGTTANKWDSIIPLAPLWSEYERILSCKGVVVLTASQPFTSRLISSRENWFKHEWIWIKNRGSNFANTKREPMKEHESVIVFAPGKWTYNKQMQERTGGGLSRAGYAFDRKTKTKNYGKFSGDKVSGLPNLRVPSSWQKFNTEVGLHPTQKPVSLMKYLILTYTNQHDVVLDNCMGSGTAGVAAIESNREFIGIESDPGFFGVAVDRIRKATVSIIETERAARGDPDA